MPAATSATEALRAAHAMQAAQLAAQAAQLDKQAAQLKTRATRFGMQVAATLDARRRRSAATRCRAGG